MPVYTIRVHEPDDPRCGGAVLIDDLDIENDDQYEAALLGSLTGAMATAVYLRDWLGWSAQQAYVQADRCSATDQDAFAKQCGQYPDEDEFDVAEQWVVERWDEIADLAEQLIDAGGVVTAASVL